MCINMLMFFKGLQLSTPINSGVIVTLTPIIILVLSAFFLKEKLTTQKVIGIFLGFVGALMLVIYGSNSSAKGDDGSLDTAVFSGTSNDYKVSRATDSTFGYVYYIQDIRDGSPDGLDTLYDIDKLKFSNGEFDIQTYYQENVNGGAGNDVITGTPGDDLIDGFGGNDTITGLAGDDILIGGDGDDEIVGGSGTNRLYGDAGDDTIISSGTNDVVDAGAGNNNITISSTANSGQYTSGDGNDIYNIQEGASGNVTITSGDGIDEFVVNSSNLINFNINANGNGVIENLEKGSQEIKEVGSNGSLKERKDV